MLCIVCSSSLSAEMYACVLIYIFVSCVTGESVNVVTRVGTVTGQKMDGYNTFFGVPYAKVDERNPFGNSIVYPNFKTPFNANDSTILCPQDDIIDTGTLQCLTLNIHVPHTTSKNIPILVWFDEGILTYASEYNSQHLVKRDIIVIIVNYRVGPYGFLCLDEPTVPGNQGMKDQIDALRWIKNNIGAFGGDPNKVTIAGQGFGGAAVDLHLYSDYEMLFDKAIVQSGSIFDFYEKPDKQAAVKIAKYLGHNVTKTKDALTALAKDDPYNVMNAAFNLSLPMSVCKEQQFKGVKSFIKSDPFLLRNSDKIKNTKIMIGYTSMELLYVFVDEPKDFWNELDNAFVLELKRKFIMTSAEYKTLGNILKKFYLGEKKIGPESMLEFIEFASDLSTNHAVEGSINKYLTEGAETVYKYLFSYVGDSEFKNLTGSGAASTDELGYLFEWVDPLVGKEQTIIRNRMTALWANFVKFGNPTPKKTDELPIIWTPVKGNNRPYLNIDVRMSMGDQLYHKRMAFWDLIWQTYYKKSVAFGRQ